MARPVRVDVKGGIYHVISRGTDRQDIFREDADRIHFLDRLAEAQRRFRLSVYGYVLMSNHFHLIVCTPDANLSPAIQWLKVSYSMWFNAKYNRVGPLFQGRFKGILVDSDESWLIDLSLYVHLNPVRVERLGLDKKKKKAESLGWVVPAKDVVIKRVGVLRNYRWSSYPFYAGYKRVAPAWLDVSTIRQLVGSSTSYRRLAEEKIIHGFNEGFVSKLKDRVALGGVEFVEHVRRICSSDPEYEAQRELRHRYDWDEVVGAVEQVKGCVWSEFAFARGDWGRAAVYYLARKYCGYTLAEIGKAAGGVNYPAVSQMMKRFERRMGSEASLKEAMLKIERMFNIQT
jgi:REP element-mobilizing transposase RayT